jgi:transposase
MKIDLKNLPSDLAFCHQIIIDLVMELKRLQEQVALLEKKVFGQSSEKLSKAVEKIIVEDEEGNVLADSETEAKKNKKKPMRQKLPAHLPREQIILPPLPTCPECGGEKFRQMSEDTSEVLEYVPATFKVIQYTRPRCVCVECDKIVQAYPPSNPISKGAAGPGLLAHILIQKYCNHLPLYRQSQIYEREGIDLSRSTMSSWTMQCATLLEPLVDCLRKSIFSSKHIHGDDTTVKVLLPGNGRLKLVESGIMFVMVGHMETLLHLLLVIFIVQIVRVSDQKIISKILKVFFMPTLMVVIIKYMVKILLRLLVGLIPDGSFMKLL